MLNKILSSVFLIFLYFGYSIQSSTNQLDLINYIYNDDSCNFNILPIENDELKEDIKKCDDIINEVLLKTEEKTINFHGKIHISSAIFDKLNEKTYNNDVTENIMTQISTLLNNYRNKIDSWEIRDDLITNNYIITWINEMNNEKNHETSKSPIILHEENIYFTPYYKLLKKIFILGNNVDQKLNLIYHHDVDLNSFNYEVDIQKISIIHQMTQHLIEEYIPISQFEFEFIISNDNNVQTTEDDIFQFITNLKLFTNINIPLNFLISNKKDHHELDFDRFLQKCHKYNINCTFSFTDSIDNYNSENVYNVFDINYNNNLSSVSKIKTITTQFQKRDKLNLNYMVSYYLNSTNTVETNTYTFNMETQKLQDVQNMTYSEM